MELTFDIELDVLVEEDAEITYGALAQAFEELGYGNVMFEEFVHALNARMVKELCGEKYARGNGDKRFQRGPKKDRTPVTTLGEHELVLQWVKDEEAPAEGTTYFRPIDDLLSFDGENTYQEDISMVAAELATKMSYRDATTEGERFTEMPSAVTINQRVFEFGDEIEEFVQKQIEDRETETVYPDATKCHSQEDDRSKHDVKITLGETGDGRDLLDVRVDGSWEDTATGLDDLDAIDEQANIVSDGDEPMVDAFDAENRSHQLDLRHYVTSTGYKLWEDDELDLETRKAIQSRVEDLVYHLRNSVITHRQDGDVEAIDSRIEQTIDGLESLAEDLEKRGCPKTSTYLRKWSNRVVTFAKLAVEDLATKVPWTSNVVERVMGEISKRCKHQWMQWTSEGLESMLRLILVRYTSPALYEEFFETVTHQSTVTTLTSNMEITCTSGAV